MTAVPPRPAAPVVSACSPHCDPDQGGGHWHYIDTEHMVWAGYPRRLPRPAAPEASPVETLQERIADVLTGWQIGYGFYALNVDSGTAREMAIAVLNEMRQGTQ